MTKVFISQPMRGKTDEEILKEREKAVAHVKTCVSDDVELIDSFIKNDPKDVKNTALWCLGRSLKFLASADVAYFVNGWDDARGCIIEHECAVAYGVPTIEERTGSYE